MKKLIISLVATVMTAGAASALEPVSLVKPDLDNSKTLMHALQSRMSVREYAAREISPQDLSDLLWAANGVNREDGKTTNPTAQDRRDIKVYVILPQGTYLYNNAHHRLDPISEGDHRQAMRGQKPALNLLIVADDGGAVYGGVNAGYVSQNIYLYCAVNGMGTVAAAGMDAEAYRKACKLGDNQKPILQHPVGYLK